MAAAKHKWWYNLATGKVEQGRQSSMRSRVGPYDTEQEAREALELAAQRTEYWDEQEERERKEDDFWGDEN